MQPAWLSLLVLWASPSEAGVFEAARSREPLPARVVERGLVMPKGWTELSVARTRFLTEFEVPDTPWSLRQGTVPDVYGRADVAIRHGLLPRVEGSLRLSHGWSRVHGGLHPQRFEVARGLLAPSVSMRWSVVERDPGGQHLAIDAGWTNGTQSTEVTGPEAAWDAAHIGVVARQRVGALVGTLQGAWVMRPPCCAGDAASSAVIVDPLWRYNPGDGPRVSADVRLQAGPLVGSGGLHGSWQGPDDTWPDPSTLTVVPPKRASADAWVGVGVQGSRGLMLEGRWTQPLARRDWYEGPMASMKGRLTVQGTAWF